MSEFTYKNITFEIVNRKFCEDCAYEGICINLRNPDNPKNAKESFMDFCANELTTDLMPKQGTLEKNLPWIFPDKETILSPVESINQYCSSFCPFECQGEQCPLYIHKNR